MSEETKTSKMNIGVSLSKNFNKITLELLDEPVEYASEEELRGNIKKRFTILKEEVDAMFRRLG